MSYRIALVFLILAASLSAVPSNSAVLPTTPAELRTLPRTVATFDGPGGLPVRGDFSGPLFTINGTFDTVDLTVNDVTSTVGSYTETITLEWVYEIAVTNTVETVIPGPGPFDPPTVIVDEVSELGDLRLEARAEFTVDALFSLPSTLEISPSTLETDSFDFLATTLSVDVITIDAILDGSLVATTSQGGSGPIFSELVSGRFSCGGLLPNAFCDLQSDSSLSVDREAQVVSASISYEEIFGQAPPETGRTNFGGATFTASVVPEPSTALLVGLGLVALGTWARRLT